MQGEIKVLKEVGFPEDYVGNPKKIEGGERRLQLKVDDTMYYIQLTGDFVYYTSFDLAGIINRFIKANIFREQIREVSHAFYTNENNTINNIIELTGIKRNTVNKIVNDYLLPKNEIIP